MKIVVIGGTGRIGSRLVACLRRLGEDAIPAAPDTGVDILSGHGLDAALIGAEAVVDLSNSPTFDGAALAFFQTAGRNLAAAERTAGVRRHVALSIVGADHLPASAYLSAKVAQETLIAQSGVPYTIVRSTQFLPFIAGIVQSATVGDDVRLSPALMQPIDPEEVVAALVDVVRAPPINGTIEIAGPEAIPITAFAEAYLSAQADPRRVIADPNATYFGAVLGSRSLIPGPGARLGEVTVADWLRAAIPPD